MTSRRTSSRRPARKGKGVTRTQTVWGVLGCAMAGVGGLLWTLQGGSAQSLQQSLEGVTLPALVAAAGPASIETIYQTRADIDPDNWQAIVIHHSGDSFGSPDSIDQQHRDLNLAGLGHHFVIGNGTGSGNGEIHVGGRWLEQLPGAHAGGEYGDWYNRHAIGICLVGNGDRAPFSDEQVARLVKLVRSLQQELGISADRVVLHREIAGTTSPGRRFPAAALREQLLIRPGG